MPHVPGRGERAPDFVLPSRTGVRTRFYGFAGGKPTALIFAKAGATTEEIAPIAGRIKHAIEHGGFDITLILRAPFSGDAPAEASLVFIDPEGAVSAIYGAPLEATTILLLDPNLRIVDRADGEGGFDEALARATTLDVAGEQIEITAQAPVLLISNALDESISKDLIAMFKEHGGVESGIEQSRDGARKDVLDARAKRRRDIVVDDVELVKKLTTCVGHRVIPEVEKAFAFKAAAFEGFKVACYDASEAGYFRPHRDNLSPATSHRRFALTLNLNDDYEGGHLRFPEYGPYLYRPRAGCAVLFSCSLLHEATEVTRGLRYVLLSFLLDEHGTRARFRRPTS